jgi:hypothetical protein
MLSALRPSAVYPVSRDIVETDMGMDAEEYNYDGRVVYRGQKQTLDGVDVYWVYDENSQRVGLVEHTEATHACLWYRDNVFSTLLQEEWEPQNRTIWSVMSQFAYEDCMKHGWTTVKQIAERTRLRIVTPDDLIADLPTVTRCLQCMGQRQEKCLLHVQGGTLDPYTTMFVDEDGVLYTPPSNSVVFAAEPDAQEPRERTLGAGQ